MGKVIAGSGLIVLSLFMLMGFFAADTEMGFAARGITFLVLVVLPAIGGGALLRAHFQAKRSLKQRGARSLQQSQEAGVLRLAQRRGGHLTVADVVMETDMDLDTAQDILTSLVIQGLGELDPTVPGSMAYDFSKTIAPERQETSEGE